MSTKIRFIVYNVFGIGGTVKTILNFADYFQKTGKYSVEIISIKKTRDTPMLYLNPNVKVTCIQDARREARYSDEDRGLLEKPSELIHPEEDLYKMFNAYIDMKLRQVLESIHDGVLITTMPSFNALSVLLVDDTVLKIGQEHKSFLDHTDGIRKLIRDNYEKLDALTILTERNRHIYERKMKGDIPIYVLGNGTEKLPYRTNLMNHIIVAAGRYSKEKGFDMLINAFALIADKFPDWILRIYGEGGMEKEYERLIHKFGLNGKIILESGSNCMAEKLSEASINVCSSYRESFGMVIIEGFAMGLPCVSFSCDGPREIITNGYDGLLVPKEDVEALASAMSKVMSDDEYRFMLGKNAYETSKKYDIAMIGERFTNIIERELKLKPNKIDHKTVETDMDDSRHNLDFSYNKAIDSAYEGKVGMKTIWKMLVGWFSYKVKGKEK